jgi:hypothetical protein
MRLRKLEPEKDALEEVQIWGTAHVNNLVGVIEDIMDRNPMTDADLDAKDKERLRMLCYTMQDYMEEIDIALDKYERYFDDLEKKVKALIPDSSGKEQG